MKNEMVVRHKRWYFRGSELDIVTEMRSIAFDDVADIREYMQRVSRRCEKVHGRRIDTRSAGDFLRELHELGDIEVIKG